MPLAHLLKIAIRLNPGYWLKLAELQLYPSCNASYDSILFANNSFEDIVPYSQYVWMRPGLFRLRDSSTIITIQQYWIDSGGNLPSSIKNFQSKQPILRHLMQQYVTGFCGGISSCTLLGAFPIAVSTDENIGESQKRGLFLQVFHWRKFWIRTLVLSWTYMPSCFSIIRCITLLKILRLTG